MIEIKIEQFVGYGAEEFLEYLEVVQSREVRIKLPKRSVLYRSSNWEIMIEYAGLAKIGQMLYEASTALYHIYPALNSAYGFAFELEITCTNKLAQVLAYLNGIYNEQGGYTEDFIEEAFEFMSVCTREEAACCQYLEVAHQFYLMYQQDARR